MRRRERERQARLTLIRDAGARVFARRGYEGATMALVAREAELGKASLCYYFETKQELFADIVSQAIDALAARVADLEEAPPLETVARWLRLPADFFARHRAVIPIHAQLMAQGPAALAELVGPELVARVAAAHAPIMAAIAALAPRLPDGALLPRLLSTYPIGLATRIRHAGPEGAEAELALFVTTLRHALAPAGAPEGQASPCCSASPIAS